MNCESCLNSRPVISENGIHPVCCLSEKKAKECIVSGKHYIKHPAKKEDEHGRLRMDAV